MRQATTLLCTVGTSLFHPNLSGLARAIEARDRDESFQALAQAYAARDWVQAAKEMGRLEPTDRICGAEVNSIANLVAKGFVAQDCRLLFFRSDTADGEAISEILTRYFGARGGRDVRSFVVTDLRDDDPARFRTYGLRNLAKAICREVRNYGPASCAIDATGGYKAQIAIAVLLGQSLSIPVYYKHERFSEIISFPPMPVALDMEVWLRASPMLFDLSSASDPVPAAEYSEAWDDRYESLVERVSIDGREYLDLSPTGQIFLETFRERFRTRAADLAPPGAREKREPRLENAGWPGEHPEVGRYLGAVTREVPFVVQCRTRYFNPDLPRRNLFRLRGDEIEGWFSDGTFAVAFIVETSASREAERGAAVAALNEWLARWEG